MYLKYPHLSCLTFIILQLTEKIILHKNNNSNHLAYMSPPTTPNGFIHKC